MTNSDQVYYRLRELKDQGRRDGGTGGDDLHPVLGFNFKYTNIQAALGLAQLERLDQRIERFAERDAWYRELLSDCPGIRFPERPNWEGEFCSGQISFALIVYDCSSRCYVRESIRALSGFPSILN